MNTRVRGSEKLRLPHVPLHVQAAWGARAKTRLPVGRLVQLRFLFEKLKRRKICQLVAPPDTVACHWFFFNPLVFKPLISHRPFCSALYFQPLDFFVNEMPNP